jgi:hypothetical protein
MSSSNNTRSAAEQENFAARKAAKQADIALTRALQENRWHEIIPLREAKAEADKIHLATMRLLSDVYIEAEGRIVREQLRHNAEKQEEAREQARQNEKQRQRQQAAQEAEAEARPKKEKQRKRQQAFHEADAAAYWSNAADLQACDRERFGPAWDAWSQACTQFFAGASDTPFPQFMDAECKHTGCCCCVKCEILNTCIHLLEATLRGSGQYSEAWLKKERLRWHPDRFSARIEFQEQAQELFKMMQGLLDRGKQN